MKNKNKLIPYICSFLILLVIWWISSIIIDSNLILPSPLQVFKIALQQFMSLSFWKAFFMTFSRIVLAFLISSVLGFLLGYLFSQNLFVKHIFEPFMSILQVTPVVALILILTFWFKSYTVPVVVAVLMTVPVMTNAVYNGFLCTDKKLIEVGKVYKLSPVKVFLKIKLPSAKAGIVTGLNSIFGLTWKVVVAGEVLCLPKFSIGTILQQGNIHLETDKVMAVTILLVLLCFCMQKIVEGLLSCKEHKNNL